MVKLVGKKSNPAKVKVFVDDTKPHLAETLEPLIGHFEEVDLEDYEKVDDGPGFVASVDPTEEIILPANALEQMKQIKPIPVGSSSKTKTSRKTKAVVVPPIEGLSKSRILEVVVAAFEESKIADYNWVIQALIGKDDKSGNKRFQAKRIKDFLDMLLEVCKILPKEGH